MDQLIIEQVITTIEASEIYPVADSTLRRWCIDREFTNSECRKSGKVHLLTKDGVERLLKSKRMFKKTFSFANTTIGNVITEDFAMKDKRFTIWYEDSKSKEIIEAMPCKDILLNVFHVIKGELKANFKEVIIYDDLNQTGSLTFHKEKVLRTSWYEVIMSVIGMLPILGLDQNNDIVEYIEKLI